MLYTKKTPRHVGAASRWCAIAVLLVLTLLGSSLLLAKEKRNKERRAAEGTLAKIPERDRADKPDTKKGPNDAFAEAVRPDMYLQASDRDATDLVARRTEGLLSALAGQTGTSDLAPEREDFRKLKALAAQSRAEHKAPDRNQEEQFRALYRRIAAANPALAFDKLLFIKRSRSRAGHTCDQFLGRVAVPGGRLFIPADVFSPTPKVFDVLARATVTNGRLRGQHLAGGSFLSPSLSYDAKTVVFAYCECGKATNSDRPGWVSFPKNSSEENDGGLIDG